MTFYFCILVVCITGLSDGTSIVCWRRGRNVTCTNDHQSPTEGHEKEIRVRCDNREIICPVIPSLSKVTNDDVKSQELKCGTNKSREPNQKCEIYYCQIEKPRYISILRTIFSHVSDLLAGLRNNGYFTGKEYTEYISPICEEDVYDSVITTTTTTTTDVPNYENNEVRMIMLKIVLPCLTVVLILAICIFLLWKKIQNPQRNLEIRVAYDQQQVELEKKMGSISDNDLGINEHVYSRPSQIYQEIPATQEDLDEVLQNPLYSPTGHPS
ncbi:uncharacterized protein LOC143956899 isoform X2 [Lithobates pipiens]